MKFQKEPFADVFQKRYSEKVHNIHGKRPVVDLLKRESKTFLANVAKFLRALF